MSTRELTRVEVLARVKAGALSVKSAAVLLHAATARRSGWCADIARGVRKDCGTAVRDGGRITRGRRPSVPASWR